ncbi:MAG TPA: TonB-dependent receptor, partial [Bryobacteraceae bacterium]|nr:TonB-dependent receptor [Bryobacteraceae bacterium]
MFVRYSNAGSDNETGLLQRQRAQFRSSGVTAGLVSVLGPTLTNDLRVNVSRVSVDSSWRSTSPLDLRTVLPPAVGEGRKLYALYVQGLGQLVQGDPGESSQTQWTLVDTVGMTAGRHNIRLGVDYQRLRPRRDTAIATVVGTYESVRALAAGVAPQISIGNAGAGSSLLETLSFFGQDTWHVSPRLNLTYGVRWEFTPPPSYQGSPLPNSNPGSAPVPAPPEPWMGVIGTNVQNTPVWKTRWNQFAPRLGVAYRLNSEGTTVVRAGTGLFYDLGFSSATDLINGAPYNRWISLAAPAVNRADTVHYAFADNLKLPKSVHWNVTLERVLARDTAVSAAYVGSSGKGLLRREGYVNPLTNAAQLVLATNNGESSFHSLQMQLRSRVRRGLRGVVSYVWGHSIDNGSWDSASFLVYSTQPDLDRGSSNFDVRHSATAALSWDVPGRHVLSRNWTLSGIWRGRTGFPIDIISGENAFGLGFDNSFRPDLVAGVPIWVGGSLNPAA